MTDEELIKKSRKWISDLCNGLETWTMRIPAEPDHDPDLLWRECTDRLEALNAEIAQLRAEVSSEIEELRNGLRLAINTVECASICLQTGELLPWYRNAKRLIGEPLPGAEGGE